MSFSTPSTPARSARRNVMKIPYFPLTTMCCGTGGGADMLRLSVSGRVLGRRVVPISGALRRAKLR